MFVFFFQAEDGIRDLIVTGVQTCALPISARAARGSRVRAHDVRPELASAVRAAGADWAATPQQARSEERRVGKESRSRWAPAPEKNRTIGPGSGATPTSSTAQPSPSHGPG